jgi:presenilin-like A22 family membrane protease
MKNLDNKLRILAVKARGEMPPRVDVADRVIAILTTEKYQRQSIPEKPLMWMAAVSSVAAVFAVLFAIFLYNVETDPLMEISQAISWVVQ